MAVINFTSNRRPTLGIEIELGLVDVQSMQLSNSFARVAEALPDRGGERFKPELMQSVLEINTDVCESVKDAERDLRGYDAKKGWMHATAHTADLLKFLARNPRLSAADAARILNGIGAKIRDAGEVFAWGEDERLASAVLAVLRRGDLDVAAWTGWLDARGSKKHVPARKIADGIEPAPGRYAMIP